MAGAGYKLFNTGDVLTAAQVNTYLQEQTVMVFADATARTTALSGVLAEGMVTYLKDTDAVEKYNGSAWVSIGGSASPLTTKGDLYTYSTTDARLAVGNNGETLVADSSATTGLRWQGDYAAGKNKIINGDFFINQRNFSSDTSTFAYGFDRWAYYYVSGTTTYSAQTFTTGAAPVAGYEARNFARMAVTGQTGGTAQAVLFQNIEDVRTFAGQTITVSFWAKAASGTPKIGISFGQNFGSGGSPSAQVTTGAGSVTISTSWTRYSVTATVPSISGKTIGSSANSSYLQITLVFSDQANGYGTSVGTQNATFDIWGVQAEAGSVATAFQTATGTLAGELAACQRYYVLLGNSTSQPVSLGYNYSATLAIFGVHLPVEMRTTPTISSTSGTNYYRFVRNGANDDFNSFTLDTAGNKFINIYNSTEISGTAGHCGTLFILNASGFLAAQAEL